MSGVINADALLCVTQCPFVSENLLSFFSTMHAHILLLVLVLLWSVCVCTMAFLTHHFLNDCTGGRCFTILGHYTRIHRVVYLVVLSCILPTALKLKGIQEVVNSDGTCTRCSQALENYLTQMVPAPSAVRH